jgi:bacteriocin-like protein
MNEFSMVSTDELNQIEGGFPSLHDIGKALLSAAESIAIAIVATKLGNRL